MIFHSLDYAIFLLVLLSAYWCLSRRFQNLLLLAGSYFFYGYVHPWFLALIVASTVVDYACGLGMHRFPSRKRTFLIASLSFNLGLLGFFKYFNFFIDSFEALFQAIGLPSFGISLAIILPVGISFYTFQTLSYSIDIYRGKLEPRRSFIDFAVFVAFFPQLVAGPIERAVHFLPQVERRRRFNPSQGYQGLLLIIWGLFKKMVIADNVAVIANKIFSLQETGFALLWVGVLAFCVQIYADFSAYTDIARGTAKLLGFELMQNFNHPYISQSPSEFWKRWHISLSSWFRDYVYIPLGGNRGSFTRQARNLAATFLLSGLWHGASWNFIIWGGYHGLLLVAYHRLEVKYPALLKAPLLTLPRIAVFFVLTNIGWLIFRETSLLRLATDLSLNPLDNSKDQLSAAGYFLGHTLLYALPLGVHTALVSLKVDTLLRKRRGYAIFESALAALLVAVSVLLHSTAKSDFIYFQF